MKISLKNVFKKIIASALIVSSLILNTLPVCAVSINSSSNSVTIKSDSNSFDDVTILGYTNDNKSYILSNGEVVSIFQPGLKFDCVWADRTKYLCKKLKVQLNQFLYSEIDGDYRTIVDDYSGIKNIVDSFLDTIDEIENNEGNFNAPEYIIDYKSIFAELTAQLEVRPFNISFLNSIYRYVENENNDSNYYSEDIWNDFVKARDELKNKIDTKCVDTSNSEALYNLSKAYDALRSCNTLSKDVDFDGKITLKDVVLIQRYIADMESFNFSQLIVSSTDELGDVSMHDVVDMQKQIAEIGTVKESQPLENIGTSAEHRETVLNFFGENAPEIFEHNQEILDMQNDWEYYPYDFKYVISPYSQETIELYKSLLEE